MTNRRLMHLLAAALLLLAASCAREEVPSAPGAARRLAFSVSDGGYAPPSGAATRAVENGYTTAFTEGDACGLYVVRGTETVYANVKLTAAADDATGSLVWQPDAGAVLAGGLAGEQYFLYYPYRADMTGKTAALTGAAPDDAAFFAPLIAGWEPGMDQSDYAAYTASDLMTAAGAATAGADNTLLLSFPMTHRMALAVIEMPSTVYKFTDNRIPDYTAFFPVTYTSSARPLDTGGGTYRHLFNPASATVPTIEGSYDGGGREFAVTPSGIAAGSYKTYRVDGAATDIRIHDLQVGDFFLADGRLLPKEADASVVQAANVAGIVFQTDLGRIGAKEKEELGGNVHGLVMSVRNAATDQWWGLDFRDEGLAKCVTKADNYNDISGYGNCEHIRASRGGFNGYGYLAFKAADGYNAACPVPAATTSWYLPSSGQLWDILRNLGGCPAWRTQRSKPRPMGVNSDGGGQGNVPAALNAWMRKIAAGDKDDFGSYVWLWSSSEYSVADARNWQLSYGGDVNCYRSNKSSSVRDVRPVLAF